MAKKWNYIFGDSIAAGVGDSQQLERSGKMGVLSQDEYGKSKVGAPPSEIVDYLKDSKWKLEGAVVVLSTGYSNGGGSDQAKNFIKQQLQYLKDKGSKVYVLGISNNPKKNPKLAGGNEWLEKTSKDYGFTFCGGFDPNETDYIHPKNYGAYWNSNVQPKLSGLPDAIISNNNSANVANTTDQANGTPGVTGTQSTGTQSNPPKIAYEFNVKPPDTRDWEEKQYETPQDLVDDISGKMIFKVESGPAPVLGNGEVEIEKGVAIFKGLEFKDPGEYTILITSTVNNIEPIKLKIKVLEKPLESKEKEDDPAKPEGSRPFIAQIDQPTIKVNDIKLQLTSNEGDNVVVASSVGLMPFVLYDFKLNGNTSQYAIKEGSISFLRLYHNGIVPEMEMIFEDSNNIFKDNPPTDDKKIRLYLDPKDKSLKPINIQFKIVDFDNMGKSKFRIVCKIDIPELYRIDYKSYLGNSTDALREVCKKLEIGYNSNITKSDDLMSWRNVGDKYYQFITDIIKHSYVSEKSFMRGFIDYYYCLNFVDVGKEMERDISNDITIDTSTSIGGDNNTKTKMFLSNELSMKQNNSNRYFTEVKFENNSTSLNLIEGIRTTTKYYDKVKKMFLIFDVDGVTSDGSKSLILKGGENDKDSFDKSKVTSYTGKIDTDNVHKNYNYSKTQNKRNLKELNNIQLYIELPNPNYSIYLYQKIDVKYVNPVESPHNLDIINWRKTGEYIVTDIIFIWKNKKLSQLITLSRKELGKNREEMKKDDKPPLKDTKTLDTPNPLPKGLEEKEPDPNSIYEVGDKFIVRDNPTDQLAASGGGTMSVRTNYRVFIIEITAINPNGVDVTTNVKEILPNSDEYKKLGLERLPELPKSSISVKGTAEEEAEFEAMKNELSVIKLPTVETTTNNTNQNQLSGKRMLIIGDSQSAIKGEKTDIKYTYPNFLKPKLKQIGVELDVLAKGGMTTKWMIENLPDQLKSNKYDIVMIYAGGNDASNTSYEISLTPSANKKGTSTDTLSNFQKMVDMCIAQGAEVFINLGYKCEDPNFKGEGKFGNYKLMKPTKFQEKSEDWIPLIKRRILIQELLPKAIKNVKKFIPVYDLNGMTSDGIHPGEEGHKIVSEKIYDEIFNKYYNASIASNTTVTSNTNSVGAKSGNVILIGGLDDKPGYLSITQQVEKLKSGMTSGKTVTGFRYVNSELPNALDAISKNPDAYVVLFSAGCQHSVKVSSAMKDKNKLFIVEGFVESNNVKTIIQTAVTNGVPPSNVIGGPTPGRGQGAVNGYTPTPPGIDHWGALKFIGSKLV